MRSFAPLNPKWIIGAQLHEFSGRLQFVGADVVVQLCKKGFFVPKSANPGRRTLRSLRRGRLAY